MLEEEFKKVYDLCKNARAEGLDPVLSPESKIVTDLPTLVEELVGPPNIAKEIRSLKEKMSREELAFKIAEKIVLQGTAKGEKPAKIAEQAIRTGLALLTEGVTAAPVQGVSSIKIKRGLQGQRYLAIYFAGPIRSAGGTDQALTVLLSDYVRQLLGLEKYRATQKEVMRYLEEIRLYERFIGRFQYHLSDEVLKFVVQHLPVEVTGPKTTDLEVSAFRNLPRVETNCIRGGGLLVINDGLAGRAAKVLALVKKVGLSGWDWLQEVTAEKKKGGKGIMEEVIVGRPMFSSKTLMGGFRLRYGRARNTGLASIGVHPLTMQVLDNFVAIGTQIRMTIPAKGGVALPVDTIEPPIVKLKDGSVIQVSENNVPSQDDIEKILFLGDILISIGDFIYSNKPLLPSPYVEEWWAEELRELVKNAGAENISAKTQISPERLEELIKSPLEKKPTFGEAVKLTRVGLPLHPKYTFFWNNLESPEDVEKLQKWLNKSLQNKNGPVTEIRGDATVKELLERICVVHSVEEGKIVIKGDIAKAFAFNLGFPKRVKPEGQTVLEKINFLSGATIRDRVGTWLDARMGRPEKAKRREMRPVVHVLFPVGNAGGPQRNILKALEKNEIAVEIETRICPQCKTITYLRQCPKCGNLTEPISTCPVCHVYTRENRCPRCRKPTQRYVLQKINLREYVDQLSKRIPIASKVVKGVKGLVNKDKIPENLAKGILRAKYGLSVYRDGLTRFDVTNAPLTHFKPKEIGTDVETLKKLGYTKDVSGAPLTSPEQMCELKVFDVIIPQVGAEYFVKVAQFLDELLTKVYRLPAFYNVKETRDLVGHLIVGIAPHTLCGVLGRIIGVTKAHVCYAHPVWHSAKRRDCDGDEDALILAVDVLINFSKEYLPERIGGIMDAPILLKTSLDLREVQRQALEIDIMERYPLKLYELSLKQATPSSFADQIITIENQINGNIPTGFTTPTTDINKGNYATKYSQLKTMIEKLEAQFNLMKKLAGVNVRNVALNVLTTHLLGDIIGNLRAFMSQKFRCKVCNRKYRRPPLAGVCTACGGELMATIFRGNIKKYISLSKKLIEEYHLPIYYAQRIQIVEDELALFFREELEKEEKQESKLQQKLADFM